MSTASLRDGLTSLHIYLHVAIWLVFSIPLGNASYGDEAIPSQPTPRWWKGNIHTHSLWSDGDDFPEMIAEWYRTHDYNFLALTDHNVLSRGIRHMKLSAIQARGGDDVLAKYMARFGADWVETKGETGTEDFAIRLKPLNEFRALVEERGKFILMEAEEISDRAEGVPVHMNATNLNDVIEPAGGATVREAMSNNLRSVEEQAKRLGREILMHLNHPNFGYAVTAEDIAAVVQERYFEVYNGHPAVGHLGDEIHPSVERLWDIANTIRIGELNAPPIFGVATDDSHNYHGKPNGASTGRGWVMVRSAYLTPERLLRAMKAGDFYASSGVALKSVTHEEDKRSLTIAVDGQTGATYETKFIGTRKGYDSTSEERPQTDKKKRLTRKYSSDIGVVLSTKSGTTATYKFKGDELFVRAVVTSSIEHDNPSFDGQMKQAWTQPVLLSD